MDGWSCRCRKITLGEYSHFWSGSYHVFVSLSLVRAVPFPVVVILQVSNGLMCSTKRCLNPFGSMHRLPAVSSSLGPSFSRRAFSSSVPPPSHPETTIRKRGPVTWASLGAFVLTCGGLVAYYQGEKSKLEAPKPMRTSGQIAVGGPFQLLNTKGEIVDDKTFNGRYSLIYFGFSYCPDVCPSELEKMAAVLKQLEERKLGGEVVPIFISVDPHRDSVAAMAEYAKEWDSRIQFLTGNVEQVRNVCRAYRVYYSVPDDATADDDYIVDHSAFHYLVNRDGVVVDVIGSSSTVTETVARIVSWMHKEKDGTTSSLYRPNTPSADNK